MLIIRTEVIIVQKVSLSTVRNVQFHVNIEEIII